ncbi:MAG: hypothetical protein DDT29_02025 [Dehalococcoidia bacterium]|nr:hypothetical protein [Bacillota bacterium]
MEEHGLTIRAPGEIATFEEVAAQTEKLGEFYQKLMVKDTDYGVIPGTKKPTLYKSGAELLRLWAGLIPRFDVNDQGTDLERGIYNYRLTCKLFIHRGNEEIYVGEGVGSCSSLEGKYRWRWLYENQLPAGIDKESLVQKKLSAKSGGSYTLYRMENSDPHDLGNTILKMAKKRSFIDATLTVTGASRIFTQDLEEDEDGDLPKGRGKPKVKPPRAKEGDSEGQTLLLEIKAEAERAGIDPRQEHNRRFVDKSPTLELLQEWLVELKALPGAGAVEETLRGKAE